MNLAAIQHMATENFCYALDEETIVISLKTDFDVRDVHLVWGDPYAGGIMGGNWKWKGTSVPMAEKKELQHHLWWSTKVQPHSKRCKYYFEIYTETEKYILIEDGCYTESEFEAMEGFLLGFFFPWMNSADICKVPEWIQDRVWYQIFPERFCNGDSSLNPPHTKPWADSKTKVTNEEYFGGDLPGVISKLDYLSDLGIGGIYFNPLNVAGSSHKYDTTDYFTIDPIFGGNKVLKELSEKAHQKDIKIMLDGVFNHSGWFFPPWQDVVKKGPNSEYWDWFMVQEWPFEPKPSNHAKSGKYMAFAYCDAMPKLNTNNQKVIDYLLEVCTFWVKEYDIDAIRLDVANEVSHEFCRQLRKKMKSLKKDFYIIGEIWHNAFPWLRGDEFDGVMNYQLTEALKEFWLNKNITVKELEQRVNHCYTMYTKNINKGLFNLLDSHDTVRLITRMAKGNPVNKDTVNKTMQEFVTMFCMEGTTCIYYGTEFLLEGDHDPDCRRCMPWTEFEEGKFSETHNWMKALIALRKTVPALRSESYEFVYDLDKTGKARILHLTKKDKEGKVLHLYMNCSLEKMEIPSECLVDKNILLSNSLSGSTLLPNGYLMVL